LAKDATETSLRKKIGVCRAQYHTDTMGKIEAHSISMTAMAFFHARRMRAVPERDARLPGAKRLLGVAISFWNHMGDTWHAFTL
jgi:hypothetical protein